MSKDLTAAAGRELSRTSEVDVYGANGEVIPGLSKDAVQPYLDQALVAIRARPVVVFEGSKPPTEQEAQATEALISMSGALSTVNENRAGHVLSFASYDPRSIEMTVYAGDGSVAQVMSRYTFDLTDGVVNVALKQEAYDGETGIPMVDKFDERTVLSEPLDDRGRVKAETYVRILNEMSYRAGVEPTVFGKALADRLALKDALPRVERNFAAVHELIGRQALVIEHNGETDRSGEKPSGTDL